MVKAVGPSVNGVGPSTSGRHRAAHGASPGLAVSLAIEGRQLVVAVRGDVDVANVPCLSSVVRAATDGDELVVVDLAEVTFADASLLRAVLGCRADLARSGVDLVVRNPPPRLRRLFEIGGLGALLERPGRSPHVIPRGVVRE